MEIAIDRVPYTMHYTHAIGHVVVIDGETGDLKFHQARGYTIRKETVRDLLSQKPFRSKGPKRRTLMKCSIKKLAISLNIMSF